MKKNDFNINNQNKTPEVGEGDQSIMKDNKKIDGTEELKGVSPRPTFSDATEFNNKESIISALPDEIWHNIFSFLENQSALSPLKLTCTRFFRVASDPKLINSLIKQYDYTQIHSSKVFESPAISDGVHKLALSPDGKMFATITKNKERINIWNYDGHLIKIIQKRHDRGYESLIFSKDSKYIIANSAEIEVWNIKENKLKTSFPITVSRSNSICALSKGRFIVNYTFFEDPDDDYSAKSVLEIYDIETQKLIQRFKGQHPYQSISCSYDEKLLVAIMHNGDGLFIYDMTTTDLVGKIPIDFLPKPIRNFEERLLAEQLMHAEISKDNQYVICNPVLKDMRGPQILLWKINGTNAYPQSITLDGYSIGYPSIVEKTIRPFIFSISKDGKYLAVTDRLANQIDIWNLEKFKRISQISIERKLTTELFFSPLNDKIICNKWNQISMTSFPFLSPQKNEDADEEHHSKLTLK